MRDVNTAHRWYELSANAGCPQGALGYGLSLMRLAQDEEGRHKAAEYVRRAADAGLANAICLFGVLTESGSGVERSVATAAQLYRQAAEKGDRSGQHRWGLALLEGRGVEPNPIEGESWVRRAALAGDGEAATRVGDLYARAARHAPAEPLPKRRSGTAAPQRPGTQQRRGYWACCI